MSNEKLIRKPAVLEHTGLSHSTLYYFISQNMFPRPVKLGKRSVAWKQSEVEEWVNTRAYTLSRENEESER